jgi:hypothetical protein
MCQPQRQPWFHDSTFFCIPLVSGKNLRKAILKISGGWKFNRRRSRGGNPIQLPTAFIASALVAQMVHNVSSVVTFRISR